MKTVTITLPRAPLPLSRCYTNVARNGRADTTDYKLWKREADAHLVKYHSHALGLPKHPKISGEVKVSVLVRKDDKRRSDIDNRCKAALDLLVRNYVIGDDSDITDLRIRWCKPFETPHATVIEVEKV